MAGELTGDWLDRQIELAEESVTRTEQEIGRLLRELEQYAHVVRDRFEVGKGIAGNAPAAMAGKVSMLNSVTVLLREREDRLRGLKSWRETGS